MTTDKNMNFETLGDLIDHLHADVPQELIDTLEARNNLHMTEKTKAELLDFPELELSDHDIEEIEDIMNSVRTPKRFSEFGHGFQDEKTATEINRGLRKLPENDLTMLERTLVESVITMYAQWAEEKLGITIHHTLKDTFDFSHDKGGFLIPMIEQLTRRSGAEGKKGTRRFIVYERELLYMDLICFFGGKNIQPTTTDTGWFVQFVRILTNDQNYESLDMHVSDPTKGIKQAMRCFN